jgi:hypothetical protein
MTADRVVADTHVTRQQVEVSEPGDHACPDLLHKRSHRQAIDEPAWGGSTYIRRFVLETPPEPSKNHCGSLAAACGNTEKLG